MGTVRFRRSVFTLSLTHGAGATTTNAGASLNGLLRQVIITSPAAVDASATTQIDILDSDNNVIYTKGSIAVNTVSNNLLTMDTTVPLSGTETVKVTYSAAQTATDTTTKVVLLIDRGS